MSISAHRTDTAVGRYDFLPVFFASLLGCLIYLTPENDVVAQDPGGKPSTRSPRIALIEPIDGSGVAVESWQDLKDRLIAVDGAAGFHNRIRLVKCQDADLDRMSHNAMGATGLPLSVPAEWLGREGSELFRSVLLGSMRPGYAPRQQLFASWRSEYSKRQDVPQVQFSAGQIPSDVILLKSGTRSLLGCDLNANLEIEPHEIFPLGGDAASLHTVAGDEAALILAQACQLPDGSRPDVIEIELWTPTSDAAARRGGVAATLLAHDTVPDSEWVWIDCGEPPHANTNEVIGPADLTAAFDAAKRHQCDLICVDLARCQGEPTITAKLLAELASDDKVSVIVNQRTIVSPNFLIEPHLIDLPDITELAFDPRSQPKEFAAAVTDWLSAFDSEQPDRVRGDTPKEQENAHHVLPAFAAEASRDRLRPLPHGDHPASTEAMFARVPIDAITAKPGQVAGEGVGLDYYQTTRCYDHLGRLVTNGQPRSGGTAVGFPLLELSRSANGFVVVNHSELARWNGKAIDQHLGEVPLTFVRGETPVVTVEAGRGRQTIEITGSTELPHRLALQSLSYLRQLSPCNPDIVPDAIRDSAEQLRDRSNRVRSWWYRCEPWPGINAGRFLFLDHLNAPEKLQYQHLQIWEFWNTGTLDRGSDLLGAVGGVNNWVRWIFVEQVMPPDQWQQSAPALLECFPDADHAFQQSIVLERVGQTNATDVDGIKRYVDRYETNRPIENHRLLRSSDAIWAGLFEPQPGGRLIRWLRVKKVDERPVQYPARLVASPSPVWWSAYRNDVAVEEVHQRKSAGQTPQVIAERMSPVAGQADHDCLTLRRWLVAIDQPEIRKNHLQLVAEVAQRVVRQCRDRLGGLPRPVDPAAVERMQELMHSSGGSSGAPLENEQAASEPFRLADNPQALQHYAWAVDALYRRFRALGYMELPQVIAERPIQDPRAHDEQLNATLFQLAGMVDMNHPEFVLARVRRQRRDGNFMAAYKHLQTYAAFDKDPDWYFKKERDLWDDMELGLPQRLAHARWFLREIDAAVPSH